MYLMYLMQVLRVMHLMLVHHVGIVNRITRCFIAVPKVSDYLPAGFEKSSSEIQALGFAFFAAVTAASYCRCISLGICR